MASEAFNPLYNSILCVLAGVVLILWLRPAFLYDKKGLLKTLGTGPEQSLISLPTLCLAVGIVSYLVFHTLGSLGA